MHLHKLLLLLAPLANAQALRPLPVKRQAQLVPTVSIPTTLVAASTTISPTTSAPQSTSGIPASPTNSGSCSLHEDHWHCEGTATVTDSAAQEAAWSSARGPEPTGRGECTAHEDHWDCEVSESGTSDSVSSEGGEGCVQHGTHFHCPEGVEASCDRVDLGVYDMSLHIATIFVLLAASGLGVFTPVIFANARWGGKRWFNLGLFTLKHFGTGIILSTAFIHLLLHAFIMFANECLGELEYEATSPAIAMAAVMVVFLVDFFAGRWMANRQQQEHAQQGVVKENDSDDGLKGFGHSHDHSSVAVNRQRLWDVQLLEAGVMFHSIMIGVTLGAQAGSGFIPTFCAIIFHQMFEGLGLGSRIAELQWPDAPIHWKKWIMCTAYALITPIGIAIGIGVHETFNLNSRAALLSIGILDSISAGILLYTAMCQLLVGDWLSMGAEMRSPTLSKTKLILGLTSMFLGLFAMSLIGKWA